MAAEWYFRSGGSEYGPVSVAELVQQASDGRVIPETVVRKGDGPWVSASKVAGLFDRAAQVQASASKPPSSQPTPDPSSVFFPTPSPSSPAPSSGNFVILDSSEGDGFKVEILAYPRLGGAKDHQAAANLYFAN